MELQEYEKDGRVISATETAYRAIYEAQGFKPRSPTALCRAPMQTLAIWQGAGDRQDRACDERLYRS